jgi:hypothetical protein
VSVVRGGISILAASLALAILFPAAWAVAGAPQEVQAVLAAETLPPQVDVVGVVSRRDAGRGAFFLIDRAEFSKCRSVSCAPASLPVRWKGPLPGVSESVHVRGAVRDTKEGKFLFAESVEKAGK